MYFAIGAALEPCSECSAKTTPAISGFFAGAKKTKKPWSRRSRPVLPARSLPWFEMTCAVPVLPATSRPSTRARPAVPCSLTTM